MLWNSLHGQLEEEVYIEQLGGFKLSKELDMICRLRKALYGLKKEPKAWYSRLDRYLLQQNFMTGIGDNNLYFKVKDIKLRTIVVYVDDIIFVESNDLCKEFVEEM